MLKLKGMWIRDIKKAMSFSMFNNRKKAIIVGLLILIAYSILGTNNPDKKVLGMFLEITSGLAVIAIAVLMFPLLRSYGTKLAFCYLALKAVEGLLMIIAGVFFLIHSASLLTLHEQIYSFHGYLFAVSALLFYFLLYQSKLIPRWLSVWGVIASVLLIIVNLLESTEMTPQLEILYLPIVLNEVVLALWLIVKGFNMPEIKTKKLDM